MLFVPDTAKQLCIVKMMAGCGSEEENCVGRAALARQVVRCSSSWDVRSDAVWRSVVVIVAEIVVIDMFTVSSWATKYDPTQPDPTRPSYRNPKREHYNNQNQEIMAGVAFLMFFFCAGLSNMKALHTALKKEKKSIIIQCSKSHKRKKKSES